MHFISSYSPSVFIPKLKDWKPRVPTENLLYPMSVPSRTRPLQNCRKLYFVSLHCKASPIQGLCLAVGFSCVVSFSRARLLTRTVLDQGILSLVLHLLGSVSMSTSTFMQTLCLKFSKGIETPSSDTFE